MIIQIPGKPIAKARPKFFRRGKFAGAYSPQETEEGKWMQLAIPQITEKFHKPDAIKIDCRFFLPIPKHTSNRKRLLMNQGHIAHIKKPDLDNLVKFVKDCLKDIAWDDDSQVCKLNASKMYSDEPRTIIWIN